MTRGPICDMCRLHAHNHCRGANSYRMKQLYGRGCGCSHEPVGIDRVRRVGGIIAECCDTCGKATDSDAHVNHCRG